MDRPSSTAATMLVKLSSARTMSEASLATSVPAMPMAMPMSACFKAGASLTPSPVMAAISSNDLRILTISCLCLGSVRENTAPSISLRSMIFCSTSTLRSSESASNSCPVKEFSLWPPEGARIPSFWEMASAVVLLSPVIMMTLIPATRHASMAGLHSGRGGSRMPTMPTKVISDSISANFAGSARSAWPGWLWEPSYVCSSPRS
mmetsp:Transcript_26689/g.62444  ORF Transcript_26689/g.62444 Transcript_26689/m.62444 type:complete len:205 (+) Transcript_26689:112-726(+)